MGLSLKGPQKQGADVLDEGVMTREVVARYAVEDGLDGNAEAAKVLPARRALWRLCEVYAPRLLAQALRARLDRNDQTGRGGVRELRRALADWLDPPPACGHCGRLLSPDLVAANPTGLLCPARSAATKTGARRPSRSRLICAPPRGPRAAYGTLARPGPARASGVARCGTLALFAPTVLDPICAPPRGPRAAYGTLARPGPARASGVARCGTLALFAPTVLDPACAASVKMMKHGGLAAYDLAVDRDARILFAVTTPGATDKSLDERSTISRREEGGQVTSNAVSHDEYVSTIAVSRRHLDRTLDQAVRANARLALKTQLKYFSPKGSITRADLVQAAMMGLRRALLDYDPNYTPAGKKSGVKISSYAINWIHQSMGELFADRDVVQVPQWAVALRRRVADMGISPGQLLAGVLAVAEARTLTVSVDDVLVPDTGAILRIAGGLAALIAERRTGGDGKFAGGHEEEPDAHAQDRDSELPEVEKDDGVFLLKHAIHSSTSTRLAHAANARPPKSKKPVSDERSREQVAAVVVDLLKLDCTGGALLTALRYAPPQFVSVSIGGERDDAGDGSGDGDSRGGGRASIGLHHLHAREDGEDEEDAAIAEAEDRRRMSSLLDAMATLQSSDPEAAEVVRRRHGLDAAGDEETLEQIGERLHSTGRSLSREAVRLAYKRGVKAMQASAGVALPDADAAHAPDDADDVPAPSRRRHSVFRPLRPAEVRVTLAAPPLPVPAYMAPEQDPEAWMSAAMVF